MDNVLSPDPMKIKTIEDIPEAHKQSNEDDADNQQSPLKQQAKNHLVHFFSFENVKDSSAGKQEAIEWLL